MAKGIDINKLCELAKLEIPEQSIHEISRKLEEVLSMFDKLDEFNSDSSEIPNVEDLKFEMIFEELRDDKPSPDSELSKDLDFKFKLKNLRDGYIVGPRI